MQKVILTILSIGLFIASQAMAANCFGICHSLSTKNINQQSDAAKKNCHESNKDENGKESSQPNCSMASCLQGLTNKAISISFSERSIDISKILLLTTSYATNDFFRQFSSKFRLASYGFQSTEFPIYLKFQRLII